MNIIPLAQKIGRNDFRLIGRDRFLLMMCGFVIFIALFLRLAAPALNAYLSENNIMPGSFYPEALSHFYPMMVGFLVIFQGALLSGAIYGFLLLDEKEDNTLAAMRVTPVSAAKFISVRMYIPAVLSGIVVFSQLQFIGLAQVPIHIGLALAIGASLTGPIATLTYANFAENKLQGFAIAKFVSIAGWIILIGWFVPEPMQWAFGLFPPFLIAKAYWMALAMNGNWVWPLLAGILGQLALIWLMVNRFHKQLAQS
ncbi:hypothetical protein [Maritalea sp.]|uniref:hypothetical protein n=1 Tax=Maritalea sp. TaxID=2003361 RepID=UPI003EFAC44D